MRTHTPKNCLRTVKQKVYPSSASARTVLQKSALNPECKTTKARCLLLSSRNNQGSSRIIRKQANSLIAQWERLHQELHSLQQENASLANQVNKRTGQKAELQRLLHENEAIKAKFKRPPAESLPTSMQAFSQCLAQMLC